MTRPNFDVIFVRINEEVNLGKNQPLSEAIVKVKIGEKEPFHVVAEAPDSISALFRALCKALAAYWSLDHVRLLDVIVESTLQNEVPTCRVRFTFFDQHETWIEAAQADNLSIARLQALVLGIKTAISHMAHPDLYGS